MNFKEQERIQEIKLQKLKEQNFICPGCGKTFVLGDIIELAHILPQRKWIVKQYGKDIIHHPMNMKATHPGRCNDAVQMSPNKSELVMKHVQAIEDQIREEHI